MNKGIWRLGLAAAAAAVIVIGIELLPGSNTSAQLTSSPTPSTSPGTTMGRLAYGLDGDIYMAEWDGSHPVRIADGRPGLNNGWPVGYWGPIWSPDGRHLGYWGETGVGGSYRGTVFIRDAQGHLVASFPGEGGWGVSWSPDSTRVATWWGQGPYRIRIYGLDGVRQTLLTMPRGFRGPDGDPVWSPDGASLLAPTWGVVVPIDGRRPYKLPADDSRSRGWVWYSPDGTRVATTRDWAVATGAPLFVGAADGSQARKLVSVRVENAVWSPAADRIAFDTPNANVASDWRRSDTRLRVVDVASGTVTTLTDAGAQDRAIRFSADGERILFSRTKATSKATIGGVSSLWSIRADGSDPQLLVSGTGWGDLQPFSPTR